jgi:hypothetical protein
MEVAAAPGTMPWRGGATGAQQGPRQTHLVKSLQEHDGQGATSIDEDSVELDVLDNGANYERIPP